MATAMLTTERVWHDLHDRLLRFIRSRVADEAEVAPALLDRRDCVGNRPALGIEGGGRLVGGVCGRR